jgi:RNA ligase
MVALDDLLDSEELRRAIAGGHVQTQTHPTLPLVIYNYTKKAQYESVWTEVTCACRGVIVNAETGQVVARPFRKFFNYGQPEAPILDLHQPVVATDKADGSLGILYPDGDGWSVATRGSFASVQALHATEVWKERYEGHFTPYPHLTYLFEIVYPENRIVLDYGDMDDLVHLGCVNTETGQTYLADPSWHGPAVAEFEYGTLAEALAAPPRPNAEGLVVWHLDSDERVKIKQADYLELHRIVTGLSARAVWQHLMDGKPLADLVEPLPDEFHPWVQTVADHLHERIDSQVAEIEQAYVDTVAKLSEGYSRKDFAMVAKTMPYTWALFTKEDGRDYVPKLWSQADPGGDWRPTAATEEAE